MNAAPEASNADENVSLHPAARAAPLSALGLERMPTHTHFSRDHFGPPPCTQREAWKLAVGGSVGRTLELPLDVLQSYPRRELTVALECAGHRRAEYRPATRGIPWGLGAVSEAVWAGTSLRDVLEEARVGQSARFVVLEGADRGPFRGAGSVAFARALPIEKALHPDTLIVWEMNAEPLPLAHGAPLRAIVPGWYAADSVKWLKRVVVLDEHFTGPFEVVDYRLSSDPAVPGQRLTALPVHSLVTSLRDGERIAGGECGLRGIAWGGHGVSRVELSVDNCSWAPATLDEPPSRYAFVRWSFSWQAQPGLRTIAVRATDAAGSSQPPQPRWNEGGYANSSIQRLRVHVL